MDEKMDMADHLVAAARCAAREGVTKDQFKNAALVFWDSWVKAQELFNADQPPPQ